MKTKDSNCKACEEKNSNALPKSQIASFASDNNMTGALTASFGTAVDGGTAGKLGSHFGGKSSNDLMKFIETPGSNKQKRNMSTDQKSKHLINSVGLGNFGLNSTLEKGIINSVGSARGESSSFLKGNETGNSLMAASALGIDVPGGDMLGIGPNDTPMFKLFKLAGFGLKLLCAGLKGKQRGGPGGYNSDTEQALGLILSIGINLDLLARLKSIFDKLLNLKPNFSGFGIQDLNIANSLFNLCDWVENMEYGSDTIDSLRKTFSNTLTNKGLTSAVGNKLISDGTYDTYAANDFGFDQQFKSIAGDIDMLKCDACNLGKTDITLSQGNKDLVNLEFDTRTGLNRSRGYESEEPLFGGIGNDSSLGSGSIGESPPNTKELTLEEKRRRGEEFSQEELDAYEATLDERGKERMKTLTPAAQKGYLQGGLRRQKQNEKIQADLKRDLEELEKEKSEKLLVNKDELKENGGLDNIAKSISTDKDELTGGIGFKSDNKSIEFVNDKPLDLGPLEYTDEQYEKDMEEIKKQINVEDLKYSQKSISTQVAESNDKLIKQENTQTTIPDKPKSVKEQLGIKSQKQDKQIEPGISDTDTLTKSPISPGNKKIKAKTKDDLEDEIKKDATSSHQIEEKSSSGITYESENKSVVYDTYTDENGDIKEDTYEKTGDESYKKTKSTTKQKKPAGGPPAEQDADEVKSFHTGETIKREELKDTVLEDADMNAVGLLHPNDLKNLKNTEEVKKTLADAEKVYDKTFAKEIEKTENLVLSEQTEGIIFGAPLPTLNGNQIVINSERILISAKTQECGIFSKRKFFVSTDDEITMNAKQRIVLKTDMHTSIESPTIHLGVYTTRNHPSLKGDCTVWWLQDLCDWLASHTHNDPYVTTSVPVQQGSLAALRARAPTLLSERIFISG